MGLFPHHPAEPGTIRNAAQAGANQGAASTLLSSELSGHASTASMNTSGEIEHPVCTSTDSPEGASKEISQASYLASGCMNRFASAIDTYNSGIDELNERYATAKAADFNVGAPVCTADGTVETDPPEDREAAIAEADAALKATLKGERDKLEDDLDAEAEAISAQLDEGPDDKTIMLMIAAGYLPEHAVEAFPGIDVETLNTIRSYFVSAQALWKAPGQFQKLYHVFSTGKDLAATARQLAQLEGQWNAILGVTAQHFDTTSYAALRTYMKSREEISILQYMRSASQTTNAAARTSWISAAKATGKVAGPLAGIGLVANAWDLGDLLINGNDGKGAMDTALRATADVTGIVSTGGSLLALTPALALGPVGAGVIIGAGIVSAGITIYRNWDEITEFTGEAADWVGSRLDDAGEAWDAVTPW